MNYIKFRLQYKKDSNSIVPDIRNKLFEQDKISHKISAVQIHRIAAVSICFVIVLSAVFVGVYSDRTNSYNNNSGLPSSQNAGLHQESESVSTYSDPLEQYKPREGATREEAVQTTLTTDKTSYNYTDVIAFTVNTLYKDDVISFEENYYVQYYDANNKEWLRCPKEYAIIALAGYTKGTLNKKFRLMERVDNVAVRYRLVYEPYINKFKVELISNEFTIDWEIGRTTFTTDKTSYGYDENINFIVKTPNSEDSINYGFDYYIEYYDSNAGEWLRCPKEYAVISLCGYGFGTVTNSFKLTERVDNIAEKYRLIFDVSINSKKVKLISNEFTIDWKIGKTTLTTDKTSYNSNEEIIFTIKAQYESDIIKLGNAYVQYYDSDARGWKRCEDKAPEKAQYASAKGITTASYTVNRIGTKAEKYRLCSVVSINDINITLISNEFTIDWEKGDYSNNQEQIDGYF
jgi:hypothetical protein